MWDRITGKPTGGRTVNLPCCIERKGEEMSKKIRASVILWMVAALTGCHSASTRQSAYGPPDDSSLAYDDQFGGVPVDPIGETAGYGEKRFVDRHPVLTAPRNYFRDSSDNIFVKAFYGTVVGIPVGVARETWQILYGQ